MSGHRPELAEATGVFALVFAGGAAILADGLTGTVGHLGVSLVFGFVILALVYALGHVCGAHFNPAITIAFATTRHFPWRRVPTYLAAQAAGATVAALLLHMLFGDASAVTTQVRPGFGLWNAFAIETLATFFLAFVIIGVATDVRTAPGGAGMAIGLTVALGALFAGPLTGGSMNPARSLGPALAAGHFTDLWLYILAPTLGAVLAMLLYEHLRPGRLGIESRMPFGALGPVSLEEPTEAGP